ncbi:MAG: glycosyltransferase family 2 protein [Gammaproteobacteria bacterium]|nr:glycosyltransferase family 2 protein [Gammaproteobacteria bacterium]
MSAIVVNYNSALLTQRAVSSILEDGALAGEVEVFVVDNTATNRERMKLRTVSRYGVTLILNDINAGFGQACNRAYEQSRGEYILLLNPDAYLLPGALPTLVRFLDSCRRAGAVGPRIYWDEAREFLLPPSLNMSPLVCVWDAIGRSSQLFVDFRSLLWRRYAVSVLRRSSPIQQKNLSGGHVLLRTKAIEASGGLFDPSFFLYYEDSDLFRRMRSNKFELYIQPRAGVVHHYNQCLPVDGGEKHWYMQESYQKYVEKYDPAGRIRRFAAFLERRLPKGVPSEIETLGIVTEPIVLAVPRALEAGWVFELSPNRNLVPAATQFGRGPTVKFTQDAWRLLLPGYYYGRLGGLNKFLTHKIWQWIVE